MLSMWLTWPGEIEDDLAIPHEIVHRALLAHVGDVDAQRASSPSMLNEVAAVVGDQRVDQQHVGAERHQLAGEVGADEAEAAGDHHAAAAIERVVVRS